jgi:hypothetical protein
MDGWPRYRKASDLAGSVFTVSEGIILKTARRFGIGRKMGRVIIFSDEDCHKLYEALPCPSSSSVAQNRPTGSSAGPSGEFALKNLESKC